MTRVRVVLQRGFGSSSDNANRSNSGPVPTHEARVQDLCENLPLEVVETGRSEGFDLLTSDKNEDHSVVGPEEDDLRRIAGLRVIDEEEEEIDVLKNDGSYPPTPPAPPPKPSSTNLKSRSRIGSSRRANVWPVVSTRTSPTGSHPSSSKSNGDSEGYNSADEQTPCYGSLYDNAEREHQFEIDIKRLKGCEVKNMTEDGNCLFRAVADQVYGDSEAYDLARQMCIDYMER
ncbi:hypothetical protein L1987_33633 [Smallanthus sonchifolius]|uniref:Uncharacterized protein n=1 Tax=Smallanthus sonchifolius TaxID=185202 RepID=A0ACB9HRK7_9ASTR|nr:hypothetical protein L1987_33633 [Smallanthus sonchifolius]